MHDRARALAERIRAEDGLAAACRLIETAAHGAGGTQLAPEEEWSR